MHPPLLIRVYVLSSSAWFFNRPVSLCAQGVSRSATIVIAYLMWKTGSTYDDVFARVKVCAVQHAAAHGFRSYTRAHLDLIVHVLCFIVMAAHGFDTQDTGAAGFHAPPAGHTYVMNGLCM